MVLWRSQPLTPKQTRDCAATHSQPQLQHLALDFLRSPMRILPSQAKDRLLNPLGQWRPPGSALLPKSPVSAHEISMPAKQLSGCTINRALARRRYERRKPASNKASFSRRS